MDRAPIWALGIGLRAIVADLAIMAPDSAGVAQPLWVHSNHLGAPMLLVDASGIEAPPGDYAQIMFPGQMRTLADLYYNRYRDYDPTLGRYIQADPIGLAGGSNPYLYAEGNPLRYTDPTGQCPWCIVWIGAGLFAEGYLIDVAIQYFWDGKKWGCIDQRQAIGSGVLSVVTGGGVYAGVRFAAPLFRSAATSGSRALVPRAASTLGKWGESRLGNYLGGRGFKPTKPFRTPFGPRTPDRIVGDIAYEAKAGVNVGLNASIEKQIAKDAYLINEGVVDSVEWHFWQGAQPSLLQALKDAGIKTVVH